MPRTPIGRLRWTALAEAVSFLVLLGIAMPLKYLAGEPGAVKVAGWVHGVLFMAFCVMLLQAHTVHAWRPAKSLRIFVAALLPFGPFFLDRGLREEDALAG